MKDNLSVIVIVLEGGAALRRCLNELQKQDKAKNMTIHVPCDERMADLGQFRQEFPDVDFIEMSGIRTYAELRSIGVSRSCGSIVAVTEDQCRPHPDWCQEIIKGHQKDCASVGGAVEKDVPDTLLSWSFFFIDYVRYMNPMLEGPTSHLTDCNVSYKRDALEAIADLWKVEFHEPEVHQALEERGQILWFNPRMIVLQRRRIRFKNALHDRFDFGRLFGSGRVKRLSLPYRIFYGTVALCLPPLTVGRVTVNVIQKKRCFPQFIRALPMIILLNTVWALGECIGYLTGTPPSSLNPAKPPL